MHCPCSYHHAVLAQLPREGKVAHDTGESSSPCIFGRQCSKRVRGILAPFCPLDISLILALSSDDKLNWDDATATLKEVRLWVHYILYFCLSISASSLSLFAPTIVQGIGYRGIHAQLFVIPPYACAFVVTIATAYISDRYRCRGLVVAACFASGTITFLIQACVSTPSLHLRYAMLVLSTCATFACLPSLCAWVPDNVHTTTAASLANAISIAFSGPGQIIGVWTYKGEQAPRYQLGHAVNAGGLLLGLVLSLGLWWFYRRKNATIPHGARKWVP